MWAVSCGQGGPEVLGWEQVPDPEPGPGEVLIDVTASAVNRADLLQRQGLYPPPPGASPILGMECSGRIAALGEGVTGWSVGDEVCALLSGGGYAERVVAPASQLLPVPGPVSLLEAAALPEVTCTVWSTVIERGRLAAGEVLLVHGGGSGIGTCAIQVGVAYGATVAVTVGSAGKAARCADLGAAITINYAEQDFVEVLRAATGGADVVLDNMGAAYLARNVEVLRPDGRLVVIGMQGGTSGTLPIAALLAKRGEVSALALRSRPATGRSGKDAVVAGTREAFWPLLESGRLRPVVDRVVPMREAATAHRLLEDSGHVGKVLLATG